MMPRRARLVMSGVSVHVMVRGNNRQVVFNDEEDYLTFLGWLQAYSKKFNVAVHAFVLMTNHVHLLLTPHAADGLGLIMKALGQRFVQYYNKKYQRTGTLWEGRFRSSLIDSDAYLIHCMHYIECNPVRASMVEKPEDYRWSSYGVNALNDASALISPHPRYLTLGTMEKERKENYRAKLNQTQSEDTLDRIRKATKGNFVLGDDRFAQQISQNLKRRVQPGKSGRPKK